MLRKCKYCGKSFESSDESLFCSSTCSHAYSSSFVDHSKLKKVSCTKCGRDVFIKNNSSSKKCLCDNCRTHYRTHYCKVCGSHILDNGSFCSHRCKQISSHIPTLIKYFGFNEKLLGTEGVFEEYNRIREELKDAYWNQGLTSREISERYNYVNAGNLVSKVFRMLDIEPKSFQKASLENWTKYNMNSGRESDFSFCKTEWHKTWDGREVFLRSSYETDYANELDRDHIWYDVESLKIKYFDHKKQVYRCAIPDFYLKETNTIVEIKSLYTFDEQNMKDKFAAYRALGYNTKLILEHKEKEI